MTETTTEFIIDENVSACLGQIKKMATASDIADVTPVEEFKLLAKAGLLKITLPNQLLDFKQKHTKKLLQLLKEVGKANLSVGRIFEGHINALYLVHLFATDSQKNTWYNKVLNNDALFGVWNTQTSNGVKFVPDNQHLQIAGAKTFCSGAAIVTHALITGNIDIQHRKGWQMLIMEMSKIGEANIDKSCWKTLGMKASGSFNVDFTGYKIDNKEFLAEPGQYFKQPFFNGGAIRFAAVQLGGIEAIAEETLAYLRLLGRMEDPLQNTRIAHIMTAVTAGNLWISQAGDNFDKWVDEPAKSADLIAFANMTRTAIEETGILVMKESNECVGARGLMHPFIIERLYRDLSFYLRQPAPDATKLDIATYFFNKFNEEKSA